VSDETTTTRRQRLRPSQTYQRIAVEWLLVVLFAGVVLAILGCAAAVVFWAWS